MNPTRHASLDLLRGVAVMGILLMNIIAFALPEAAYVNPLAWGNEGPGDLWAWSLSFLLVDGKFRGLFTLMFGASMLLIWQRAEAAGENGARIHRRRIAWLLVFGLAHYFFVWSGDILTLYALCGLIGVGLLRLEDRALLQFAVVGAVINMALVAAVTFALHDAVTQGDASALADLGVTTTNMTAEVARAQAGFANVFLNRLREDWSGPIELLIIYGPETLALMAIGMVLLRNGFLTGGWTARGYQSFAAKALAMGLIPESLLLGWCWHSGLDPVTVFAATVAWSLPFRIAAASGYAALVMLAWQRFGETRLALRIAAAGRAAFTNYLGTSIVMTALFIGFGLFGSLSRWQALLVCLPAWGMMLLWSKPWLARFRYGPFEWAWRSLSRGRFEKLRIA